MTDVRKQAITGLVSPQQGEAMIREAWPSVAAIPPVATLGRVLTRTGVLAPLGWLVMAGVYFGKLLPGFARRYTLTNRRLMVRRGLRGKPVKEIALADIDEVRVRSDANSAFFRAGDLDIVSKDRVVLTLRGVPEPESFRHAIVNAYTAWVPGKSAARFVPASATP